MIRILSDVLFQQNRGIGYAKELIPLLEQTILAVRYWNFGQLRPRKLYSEI